MCAICGQPGFVRCNCQSAQPFCDQCQNDSVCKEIVDSQCVVYHFQTPTYTPPATRLINLNLPNGSSAQTIFEAIDAALGSAKPWVTGDTNTLHLFTQGPGLPITLKGDVKISAATGNTISANPDGLFAPDTVYTGKVRVDVTSPLRYLEDSIVGGTDGCVTIDVVDQSGLLAILPNLDPLCLANLICASNAQTKQQFGACIVGEGVDVADTASIHMMKGGFPITLSASSKISGASGNTISIQPDGLFSSGTSASADNGLSVSGGVIQLGGSLIKNTNINFGSSYLTFTNDPEFAIGMATPSGFANFEVLSTTKTTAISAQNQINFTPTSTFSCIGSTLQLIGTNQSHSGVGSNAALYGQFWFNNTGSTTLGGGAITGYAGTLGYSIKSGPGNLTGNIPSGLFSAIALADSGNIDGIASTRIAPAFAPPLSFGGVYTGTITNFYSLYIDDISAGAYSSQMTNKFALYQAGTSDISRFFGPVQNAGGTTQFTSDERVKENISLFKRGLNEIEKINTRIFNYTYNKDKTITGIIAQELENIIPEAVEKGNFDTPDGDSFTDFRMVDQNVIFYTMLNAIKDLSDLNKSLTDRITALENKSAVFGPNN